MKVKNILKRAFTIVLAGAMSLAVFTACGENEDKKPAENLSAKEMLLDVFETATNSNSFAGIFSGKANAASKSDAKIEFGKGVTDALGTEVKPLSLSSETKLKGSKAGTDIVVTYDDKDLVSLNGVYDNDSKTIYLRVPELSDAYLSASSKDFDKFKDLLINSENFSSLTGNSFSLFSSIKALSKLKIDEYKGIFKDYVKVVSDSLPKTSKEEDLSGKIDAVEYNYKLKTYELTKDDINKIVESVFEKLKSDDKVRDIAVSVLGSAYELSDDNYASKVDEAKKSLVEELSSLNKNIEIGLIFDGNNIVGIKSDKITFVCVDRNDAYALSVDGEGLSCSFTAIKDGKKLDLYSSMDIKATDDNLKDFSATISVDDFEVVDKKKGLSNGDYEFKAVIDGKTVKFAGADKAEENKVNSELKISVNDVEYATITATNEIINASDITIPSGTVYTLDQIEEYQSSMKNFMSELKKALGKDLTSALSKLSEGIMSNAESKSASAPDASSDEDKDSIMLENYYNDDGSFNYDKLKEDLGKEEYKAFMSQINIEDFEVDADDIEF